MGSLPIRRTLHLWIACLAMLLNALTPSLSHALAASGRGGWIEVCSAAGKQYVAAPAVPSPADTSLHQLAHCPFCLTHAGSFALPAPQLVHFPVLSGHDRYPPLPPAAALPVLPWRGAQPRGPPSLS